MLNYLFPCTVAAVYARAQFDLKQSKYLYLYNYSHLCMEGEVFGHNVETVSLK
jgi:hypothetical protein